MTESAQENHFYLRDGDKVVFYGDSITEQLLYTTFVESFVLTRWPELDVTYVNAGWSGERVSGSDGGCIDLRLQRDVLAHRPSVVTIMLGMNDGNVEPYSPELFNTFAAGYRYIIKTLKEARTDLRITLIKPSPYDDVTRAPLFGGGYNEVLIRYGDFVAELAREMKLDFADLNTSVIAALVQAKSTDAIIAQGITPDRIHPRPCGHLLMAQALLQAWNASAIVSVVEIDAAKARPTRAENTEVLDLVKDQGLAWTQVDKSLPMPLDLNDPALALAVQSGGFIENLNQQLMMVTGLTAPHYTLKIDGEEAGSFTKESLRRGISLAMLPTPMHKQAMSVHSLTLNRNHIEFALWREIRIRFHGESSLALQQAQKALAALESELFRRQREVARPKAHRFELTPIIGKGQPSSIANAQ